MDLTQYAKTMFYAGVPEKATLTQLVWNGFDYTMEVRVTEDDEVEAVMTSGRMEWICLLDKSDLKNQIDGALEDACQLGRIANWSNDE